MNEPYENDFLKQIYDCQIKLENSLETMLQIIFNLYDDDGDGIIPYQDYIGFISDLLLISTYMNRLNTNEYNYENVLRISRWSCSNFTINLFREPQQNISYELFVNGITQAITEHKDMPILGKKMYLSSLMPELLNYFNFYDKIAKRRGWPIPNTIPDQTPPQTNTISEQTPPQTNIIPEQTPPQTNIISEQTPPQPDIPQEVPPVIPQITQEEQIVEYQQRRQQQFRQHQEILQREQQRAILELQQQRQQEFQTQFRDNIENRQQDELERQEELNRLREQSIIYDAMNQFEEENIPENYKLENIGIIKIDKNETGFDPIEGQINIEEFVNLNKETNIVFKFSNQYYLVDKTRLHTMSSVGLKDNSIFYGCMCEIENDWTNPHTWNMLNHVVILDPIYFNIQHLGLPVRYVKLDNIRAILHPNNKFNYFVIEKPIDYLIIPSFASDNVLKHGVGSMSGLHCQTGQEDTIYTIKKFIPEFV